MGRYADRWRRACRSSFRAAPGVARSTRRSTARRSSLRRAPRPFARRRARAAFGRCKAALLSGGGRREAIGRGAQWSMRRFRPRARRPPPSSRDEVRVGSRSRCASRRSFPTRRRRQRPRRRACRAGRAPRQAREEPSRNDARQSTHSWRTPRSRPRRSAWLDGTLASRLAREISEGILPEPILGGLCHASPQKLFGGSDRRVQRVSPEILAYLLELLLDQELGVLAQALCLRLGVADDALALRLAGANQRVASRPHLLFEPVELGLVSLGALLGFLPHLLRVLDFLRDRVTTALECSRDGLSAEQVVARGEDAEVDAQGDERRGFRAELEPVDRRGLLVPRLLLGRVLGLGRMLGGVRRLRLCPRPDRPPGDDDHDREGEPSGALPRASPLRSPERGIPHGCTSLPRTRLAMS